MATSISSSRGSSSYDDSSSSSVQESYRIADSDSDEGEDDDCGVDAGTSHVQEIANLKDLTKNLLNTEWKMSRNKQLLTKMLELEEPSISPKMVDFLLQDGVCDMLLEFITQIGDRRRPYPHESDSQELRHSYRATMLLSVDEPSDALMSFLNRRASVIARAMFEVYREDSAGSFYHAARVIESLLRLFPGEVYDGLTSDGQLEVRMGRVLRYIGYPPVGDLIVILVALTPIPRTSPLYAVCSSSRWKFFEGLSKWIFMLRLANIIVAPATHCRVDEYVTPEQHCSAASQTLQELIEKLSIEDIGEILLQPLGYTISLLNSFMDKGTGLCADGSKLECDDEDSETFFTSRRVCLRLLCFLLKRSAAPENVCFVSGPMSNPVPTRVPNRLYPLRPLLVEHLTTRLDSLQQVLVDSAAQLPSTDSDSTLGPIVYPGHVVKIPFSSHRAQLVELLVLLVEASESVVCKIREDLWKLLISWVFDYAYNDIYHSMFYRLLFTALRQNDDSTLKILFKNAKLITFLLDAFDPLDGNTEGVTTDPSVDPGAATRCSLSAKDKASLRGFVINATNAIRLQVSSLPPSSFLRNYLHSHQRWNEFIPHLRAATEVQQPPGLGNYVPVNDGTANGRGMNHIASLLAAANEPMAGAGIDHGSKYAKSLGFDVEIEWPVDANETTPKKKKKGKKKKKNNRKKKTNKEESEEDCEAENDDNDGDDDDDGEESRSSDASLENDTSSSVDDGERSSQSSDESRSSEGTSSDNTNEEENR
mmetsp:Transcript_10398/g.15810  ORF Transcript_10398/g.15810 Transcript_10398/m.15810 type:complete len:763 (-) Transcript_10398:228-2516(-)|eukprot:CAMPEP_0185028180 /NCGR_PEP_ID=MMETSP1103-20130426/13793_1 /TAXON_ID=36769 /ORGANISM="Paraphysomonas bandaiensis, Strain Caron Lab Isolate" /LENGTH=762 /DNA_ID=CAMNT_0027562515 /DNA_START=55 /DNA_END=2343 /DNA_ORIENTATION=-